MNGVALADEVREAARGLGFAGVGITAPDPSHHLVKYRSWIGAGFHGEMGYLAREDAVVRRADLEATLPGVRSVVVVADRYASEDAPGVPDDPSVGVIARYARGRDYHKVLHRKLRALAGALPEAVSARAYVDTGPILERDLGRRAGLGWFGRNTMLIHPRKGSYFFLGVLLVDVEMPADAPFTADHCGSCRACLDACPTGALLGRDRDGAPLMDARRCISYLTIEHRGPIPVELRPLMGNRVFGCDICQEVCPFTRKFSTSLSDPAYAARPAGASPHGVQSLPSDAPHPGTASPSLIELLETALDEAAWGSFSRGSPMRRAGRAGFARNVCVALGNWGSAEAVPVLASALRDSSALIRGHAAWALGRIDAQAAVEALSAAAVSEDDPFVRGELTSAVTRPRTGGP